MACSNITGGFTLDCNNSNGGIDKIFIANCKVESITEANGTISAITVAGSALTPSDFFIFETPRQTSSFVETINVSQENGTVYYDQALTCIFNKLEASKRNEVLLMAQATDMVVVFKDNNGKLFSVGIEKGAFMSAGTANTGVAYGDRSGYELTITGMESSPAFEVDSAIVEA